MKTDNVIYQDSGSIHGGLLSEIKPEQRAGALKGAQLLARCLQLEGVEVVFGYPGGANLEIFDALHASGIRCVRVEHEQGAAHAAQGYARATGKVGVCLATSGPGATNLVTGIADANSDSTPIVAITGNVPTRLLGRNAFQEVDIVSIVRPITKRAWLVDRVARIPEVVREAFALAGGNRPGPVLIDLPKDIQQHYPRDVEGNYVLPRMPAVIEVPEPKPLAMTPEVVGECLRMIREARRPILYVGGGIISAAAEAALLAFAERTGIPVVTTVMGVGAFPPTHPLCLDVLGMHGAKYANIAVNEADLVIALGVRFDDRVTGNVAEFIKSGHIIHVDIDRRELNKNKTVTLPICADVREALTQLAAAQAGETDAWRGYCARLKCDYPYPIAETAGIAAPRAIALLSEMTQGRAIVSLGVGQHQMWAMQHYRVAHTRSLLSSSGFGTMGYGLPAAIGAKLGCPERTVIDIDGDGSFNMSIHELSTCRRERIGVKIVVINNQWLGMVRQWQDMIYDGRRACSDLSDPMSAVKAGEEPEIYPDFVTIARGYRVKAERVSSMAELADAYVRMLADPGEPYLLDVIVDPEVNVYPMIPAGATYRDIIMCDADVARLQKDAQGANV
ncbi:biosynthetic-type acetolactate synthase large subunit [Solimonas terrae]|uniref:Acetolactate synthase n=1 Tax=Solimonas terrae TaxID=1396819 RepID=A0A6M2BM93_9GAMM|nr:biosynthetic-type acetolactate synthase large subunit [Solimonas terrae]NGY03247.1 biosynthetic-type acetolactate synthase large subunit [Solimonas terrae]